MDSKPWFEVDREGLRALQEGKSKTFILNELVQNAFDEDIKQCKVDLSWSQERKELKLEVEDDSPEGFKDITHAYTLFADTYKRQDPTKRGRFNLGEKQVIAISNSARVETTKGTVVFDGEGRHEYPEKRNEGSKITVYFNAEVDTYEKLLEHVTTLLVPEHISFVVNGKRIKSKTIFKSFTCSLLTEVLKNKAMMVRWRKTQVDLISHNDKESYIYEMGIPIRATDCPWHINVQQKIILNIDRDNINHRYLKDLYSKVLNEVYENIEDPSSSWVRTAMKAKTTIKEAVNAIVKKRFGEKICIANPLDRRAMDEAIVNGYKPIFGPEMTKEEWAIVKEATGIESATSLFGDSVIALAEAVPPNDSQAKTSLYAQKIAKRLLNIDITVTFIKVDGSNVLADYNSGTKELRFNLSNLGNGFFAEPISAKTTDLIIHELAHENGLHAEKSYLNTITKMGGQLTMLALREPAFFEVN